MGSTYQEKRFFPCNPCLHVPQQNVYPVRCLDNDFRDLSMRALYNGCLSEKFANDNGSGCFDRSLAPHATLHFGQEDLPFLRVCSTVTSKTKGKTHHIHSKIDHVSRRFLFLCLGSILFQTYSRSRARVKKVIVGVKRSCGMPHAFNLYGTYRGSSLNK